MKPCRYQADEDAPSQPLALRFGSCTMCLLGRGNSMCVSVRLRVSAIGGTRSTLRGCCRDRPEQGPKCWSGSASFSIKGSVTEQEFEIRSLVAERA